MMPPITTDAEYEAVLARIDVLMTNTDEAPDGELQQLVDLVLAYERERYPDFN